MPPFLTHINLYILIFLCSVNPYWWFWRIHGRNHFLPPFPTHINLSIPIVLCSVKPYWWFWRGRASYPLIYGRTHLAIIISVLGSSKTIDYGGNSKRQRTESTENIQIGPGYLNGFIHKKLIELEEEFSCLKKEHDINLLQRRILKYTMLYVFL